MWRGTFFSIVPGFIQISSLTDLFQNTQYNDMLFLRNYFNITLTSHFECVHLIWLLWMSVVVKQKPPYLVTPVFFCLISNNSAHICSQFMLLQPAYRLPVSSLHASSILKTWIPYTSLGTCGALCRPQGLRIDDATSTPSLYLLFFSSAQVLSFPSPPRRRV